MITQKEKLRREKISKTIRERQAKGEIDVAWNRGMKMSESYKKKLSTYWKTHNKVGRFKKGFSPWNKGLKGYQAGEKHYNWKGGKITESKKMHGSTEWKNWRKSVFERDNYTCQFCYKRGIYLEAHHIKFSEEYPELRFEISNGLTLCKKCHKKYHKLNGRKTLKNFANSVNA